MSAGKWSDDAKRQKITFLVVAVAIYVAAAVPMFLDTGSPGGSPSVPALDFAPAASPGGHVAEASVTRGGMRWSPAPPDASEPTVTQGQWGRYVLLPARRAVCPERVAVPVAQDPSMLLLPGALACAAQGSGSVASATHGRVRLVLDFGREMSGRLEVRFGAQSAAGSASVAYSESLAFLSDQCDQLGIEGLQAPPTAHVPPCPREITLHGGAQSWYDESPRSGFRYALVTLTPAAAGRPIEVIAAGVPDYTPLPQYHDLSVASVYKGWFQSSDDALNRYWFDGAYTAQADTVAAGQTGLFYEGIAGLPPAEPVMVDGAKRDRYVWYDLAGPKTLIPLLYGDTETPKDTLLALGQVQTVKGFIPACRPPASFYGAPCATAWTDATAWWVIALGEYWLWTGDAQLAKGAYPAVAKALAALASCRAPNGLIAACNGVATYDTGSPGRGASTYLNAIYYEALRTAAKLALVDQQPSDAVRDERTAGQLRSAVNKRLWDSAAHAYVCNQAQPKCHSQDANVLPALWGIADPRSAGEALAYVKAHLWTRYGTRTGGAGSDFGTPVADMVANWISYFELQARLRRGETTAVRSMLGAAWRYMNIEWKKIPGPQGNSEEPSSTTTWEHIVTPSGAIFRGPQSSLSHVWSAGATLAETTGLLGLQPTQPGFSSWTLQPHASESGLHWVEGQIPTPHGDLRASWHATGPAGASTRFSLEVSAPSGTVGTVYVPLYGHPRIVTEDGRITAANPTGTDYLRIQGITGRHVFGWG